METLTNQKSKNTQPKIKGDDEVLVFNFLIEMLDSHNRFVSNCHYRSLYLYYDGHPLCLVYSFLQVRQIHHLAL